MAQFNADILLAVRGSEKAQKQIEKLEASIAKLGKAANLDVSGQIRLKGEQNLLKERIKNFGILQKELKVSQEIARLANKQARQRGNANQYSGPIGPGQASSTALSSSLAMRRNQIIQQRSRGLNQFPLGVPAPEQDPVRDQQRRAKIIERNIALRNRVKAIARATAKIEASRDARLKGQNSLTNGLLKLNKATLNAARSEAQERGESVANQRALNNELKKTQQYSKAIGPKQAPSKGGARRGGGGGGAGGGLAAGIGFPLLFGGGPGSVLGGALGSAGGFGTQILASAIGGIIDQTIANVAKLGQALDPLTADIDAVVAAVGETNTAFGQLVKDLEKAAGKEKALALATAQLAIVIDKDGVQSLQEFGKNTADLGNEVSKSLSLAAAGVANLVNKLGLLTALTNAFESANLLTAARSSSDPKIAALFNQINAKTSPGERRDIEAQIIALEKINQLEEERKLIKQATADITAANAAEYRAALEVTENELAISRVNAGLENDKVFALRLQGIELKKNEEINANILALNNKQITRAQALANQTAINNRAEAARNELVFDQQKARESLDKKAANEQKRLARETEQARRKELRVQQQLAQISGEFITDSLKLIEIQDGKKARLEAELEANVLIFKTKAKEIQLSGQDSRIQKERLALLDKQAYTRQEELKAQLAQIAVAERLKEIENRQSIENTRASLGQELGSLALGLSPELELVNEQANRLTNTIKDLDDQLEKLQAQRIPGVENKELESAIKGIQGRKLAYQELLPAIFAAEQQQLKYNQALAAVTPGVNALVGGLREVAAGTKTAEEAFADFLNTIADQLINTAATMIAQFIAIGIARRFAFDGPGSSPGLEASGGGNPLGPLLGDTPLPFSFEGGGYTGDGPRAGGVDGKGGFPAILHPGEYVYDGFAAGRAAMGGAQKNASPGASAESSSSFSTTNNYMSAGSTERESSTVTNGSGSMVIETQVINNVEYATLDQVRAASAASAKQARSQVFSDLRNKQSRRAMVGLR